MVVLLPTVANVALRAQTVSVASHRAVRELRTEGQKAEAFRSTRPRSDSASLATTGIADDVRLN